MFNDLAIEPLDESAIGTFFNKKTLNISGWNTTDAYSNEVNFLIRNIQTNTLIDEKIFKIPNENDL